MLAPIQARQLQLHHKDAGEHHMHTCGYTWGVNVLDIFASAKRCWCLLCE